MNKKLWNLYLKLQTEYAYSKGSQLGEAAAPTYGLGPTKLSDWGIPSSIAACQSQCLIIGPGGTGEIDWLRNLLPQAHIAVLTAYISEVTMVNRGMDANIEVLEGDIHDMPFSNSSFDYIFAANVLEHTFAPYIALMECRRVIKLGGAACFLVPSFRGNEGGKGPFHLHCLTEEVWGELMVKTGMDAIGTKVIHGDESPEDFYLQFICHPVSLLPSPHNQILDDLRHHKKDKRKNNLC